MALKRALPGVFHNITAHSGIFHRKQKHSSENESRASRGFGKPESMSYQWGKKWAGLNGMGWDRGVHARLPHNASVGSNSPLLLLLLLK